MSTSADLCQLIQGSRSIVAITGAGISTLSGIADFRSKHDGIFKKEFRGLSLESIHEISHFRRHPEDFYDFARTFHYRFHERQPNIVHTVLAKMQQKGILRALYTQNIDGLHQRAGSTDVGELHGTVMQHHCLKCGAPYSYDDVRQKLEDSQDVPKCDECGGLLKPDVVFFGEGLDGNLMDAAEHDLRRADLLMVLGSSLTVFPVAALPEITLRAGGKLVIVNKQSTPLDTYATLCLPDLLETFNTLNQTLFL